MNARQPARTVGELLNAIKARRKLRSDYALAKHLGVRVQVISNYRNRKSLPDEVMAIRIADELGMERGYVLACVAAERAELGERFEVASTWRALAEKMGVAVVAVVAVSLLSSPLFDTEPLSPAVEQLGGQALHIMLNGLFALVALLGLVAVARAWRTWWSDRTPTPDTKSQDSPIAPPPARP